MAQGRGYRKVIQNAVKDFSPDTKNNVIKLLDSWEEYEHMLSMKSLAIRPAETFHQ
jgi:hypothetical protein